MANTSYEIYIVHHDEFYCMTELKGKDNKNIDSIAEHIKEYGNLPIDVGSEGGPEEGLYHVEVIKHYYNRCFFLLGFLSALKEIREHKS